VKRETRINLLFIGVFLAISVPGAVILFRKKLDPNAARMDQPDAVVAKLPYMAPPLSRPGVRWVVPPLTQDWLTTLNREHGANGPLLSSRAGTWAPVISDDHVMQLIDLSGDSAGARASFVLWGIPPGRSSGAAFSASTSGEALDPGRVESVETIAVPEPLKRELMGMNEVKPPAQIVWVRVIFPKWPRSGIVTISGDFSGPSDQHPSTITIESNAAVGAAGTQG